MIANRKTLVYQLVIFLLATTIVFAAGCAKKEPQTEAKRYPFRGRVISVEKADKQVVIAHDAIPGLMEGMTMGFHLKDERDFDRLQRGDRVQATLVVQGSKSYLETLFITRPLNPDASDDEVVPKPLSMPKPGDAVPDVALVNQDGKRISPAGLHGKVVVLTFIFTRCPLPDFCPLMNQNFAKIAKELEKDPARAARAQLLSISFDTAHDTPPVLKKYRQLFVDEKVEPGVAWDFASGKATDVRTLGDFFGLSYKVEGKNAEDTVHTLRTAVIGPDGKVAKVFTGNSWQIEEVLAEIRKL